MRYARVAFLILLAAAVPACAAEAIVPPGDAQPILRLDAGGPRSYLSGVAFSPSGDRLYAAGWDKVVHVWSRGNGDDFVYRPTDAYRIPIGAGPYGGLNALAQSQDGKFLAVGGQGYARGLGGLKSGYWILPAGVISAEARLDNGLIYVFDTASRRVTLLRGHTGPVQSLTFTRGRPDASPVLVSVAEEYLPNGSEVEPRVRVWDVAAAAEIAQLVRVPASSGPGMEPLPPLQGWRPTLQAWSTGRERNQLRVAIGWGDKRFRLWDVATNNMAQPERIDNTLTVLPVPPDRPQRVLVGGHGQLGEWSLTGALDSAQDFHPVAVPSLQRLHLVSAGTLIPSTEQGGELLAAFVVTKFSDANGTRGPAEYRLLLATVDPGFKVVREIPLPWRVGVRLPALAASADGQTLAVAGNERNEVELYSLAALRAGEGQPWQVLRGEGILVRDVAFASKGTGIGLVMSPTALPAGDSPPDGSLLLDIENRIVQRASEGWQLHLSRGSAWRVDMSNSERIEIQRQADLPVRIALSANQIVTSTAISSPSEFCPVSLLAVASHERGQPKLQLFRADTGEELRRCSAHTERIRSVRFSGDGRMLVSAGDDRVVAVWSLVDIASKLLGKRGRLPDVSVHARDQDQAIIVDAVPQDSPLKVGDIVLTAAYADAEVMFATPAQFHRLFLDSKPGDDVVLSVRRGNQEIQVTVRVGQAVEDAKPLFSMFVTPRPDKPRDAAWSWIGWHPLGNFDASDEQVEQRLAWHFNTGEAEAPARFAVISEYRDEFYQRNLLAQLVRDQSVRKQAVELEPQMSFWMERGDGQPWDIGYEDESVVRSRDAHAVVHLDGVPESRLQSFDVRVADGEWQPLSLRGDGDWSADLSQLAWSRGLHRVEVRLQATGSPPREYSQTEHVRYRPEPPRIEWVPQPPPAETSDDTLAVAARVTALTEAASAELSLDSAEADKPVIIGRWSDERELSIEQTLSLKPGENRIVLRAWNTTAAQDDQSAELVRRVTVVHYKPRPEAPRVEIISVDGISDGISGPLLAAEGVYRTVDARVQVTGRVIGTQPLTKVLLRFGGKEWSPESFRNNSVKEYTFRETLTLAPGSQALTLSAAVQDQAEERRIDLQFAPRLPRFDQVILHEPELLEPLPAEARHEGRRFYAGYHAEDTILEASLKGPLQYHYEVRILVNDVAVEPEHVSWDRSEREHRLKAQLHLPFGKSRVRIVLANPWVDAPVQEAIPVEYLRPPRVREISGPGELEGEPLTLTCRVDSLLPPRPAVVTVDDRELPQRFPLEPLDLPAGRWELRIPEIGLTEGQHTVHIRVENAEGLTLSPAVHRVTVRAPIIPPPSLVVETPGDNSSTRDSHADVKFTLDSASPAVLKAVVRNHDGLETWSQQREEPAGRNTDLSWQIPLQAGPNAIELVAISVGGQTAEKLHLTRVEPPITVEIVSVGTTRPRKLRTGEMIFDAPVASSRAVLRGHVKATDPNLIKSGFTAARIWVNHFKLPTVPVTTDVSQPGVGIFESELIFNLPRNRIQVEIVRTDKHLATELASTSEAIIECSEPTRDQELHLVLIGVSGDQRDLLKESARKMLEATRLQSDDSRETWKSAAFSRIHVDELFDRMTAHVQTRLRLLISYVNQRRGKPAQPIIMLYYRGRMVVSETDFALRLIDNWNSEPLNFRQALSGRFMERALSETTGAHLIALDLNQASGAAEARDCWPKAPHLGLMMANWVGKEAQPENTRLISTLEQTMPKSRILRELDAAIYERYAVAQQQYPERIETLQQIENLHDIRLVGGDGN